MTRNEHEKTICLLFEECLANAYKESLLDRGQCLRLYGAFLEYLSHEAYAFLATLCSIKLSGMPEMTAQAMLLEAIRIDVSRYLSQRWPKFDNEHSTKFLSLSVCSIVEVFLSYAEDRETSEQRVAKAAAAVEAAAVLHSPCFR